MTYRLILTAAAVLAASPAIAAPHEGSAFIQDYDTNTDGSVTRAEFDAMRTARFNATDANKDGWVSEQEYVGEYTARLDQQLAASSDTQERKAEERERQLRQAHVRFGVLDRDKDGKMMKADYDASGTRAFTGMDDDKDDVITQGDATAVAAKQQAAREAAQK